MIKNYFKIAWRNLSRNKAFSFINIFGLAIGLATCLLITLFVTDELSYDRYNKNAGRIFRINDYLQMNGNVFHEAVTPAPLGPAGLGARVDRKELLHELLLSRIFIAPGRFDRALMFGVPRQVRAGRG